MAWEREGRREKEDERRETGRVQVATAPMIQRNSAADVPSGAQNKEMAFQQHEGELTGERLDGGNGLPCEAVILVRWNHPGRSRLSLREGIPALCSGWNSMILGAGIPSVFVVCPPCTFVQDAGDTEIAGFLSSRRG